MRSGGLEMMSSSSGILSSSSAAAIVALNLKEATNWWSDVNESPVWQDRIFHILAVLYGIVSVIAVGFHQVILTGFSPGSCSEDFLVDSPNSSCGFSRRL